MAADAQDRIEAWHSNDGGRIWLPVSVNPRSLIGHWLRGPDPQEIDDGCGNLYRTTKPKEM